MKSGLIVCNTGNQPDVPTTELFKRFKKAGKTVIR